MGNNSSRESRGPDSPSFRRPDSATAQPHGSDRALYASRSGRGSRPELSLLGISSSSHSNEAPERRETKQEREARKLEKERVARLKERERSIKEEHVDGGYLVTMGVYTGLEDFNKAVVRQLMIERRIAPFWRGIDDFKEDWTEHQLVAAGRGLSIPAADEIPAEELRRPLSPDASHASNPSLQSLTVPISSRSLSTATDASTALSPSYLAFSDTSSPPTSPVQPSPSPFRPRSKTLASLTTSLKHNSSAEMIPREIQLPKDPFVNGQAIEVFLYKDATECPICFLYYPPFLNKTRCCDQSICSECFVQIKRPDPHPPEHHNDPSNPDPPPPETLTDPETLVSEPATCPYCQQAEFGVTYEPPPFRRGLAYANPHGLGSFGSAMSSSTSINSTNSPTTLAPQTQRRRTTSVSVNSAQVISTDKVRPDWATKLANARSHLARRSAAATALHTAAYLIGNGNPSENRGFSFAGRGRFGRHRGDNSPGAGASGSATPTMNDLGARSLSEQLAQMRQNNQDSGGSNRRRSRMDDLEEMMMMEAIRLSLAAEEERKRKVEREAAKDAKKRAKEEKKREKKERKVYGSGNNSVTSSALSLSLPGIGLSRRRGNSGGSNLIKEFKTENLEPASSKGKEVDRDHIVGASSGSAPISFTSGGSSRTAAGFPGAHWLDGESATHNPSQASTSPTAPDKRSHLRTMSNASSPASSFVESAAGSLRNEAHPHGSSSSLDTPNESGTHLPSHRNVASDGGDSNGSAGSESMFNFSSLAAMIGDNEEDKADAAKHIEHLNGKPGESSDTTARDDSTRDLEESIATLKVGSSQDPETSSQDAAVQRQTTLLEPRELTPEVMVTPVTPAAVNHGDEDSKQLGAGWSEQAERAIVQ